MNFTTKYFSELTLNEFHDIIALRLKVFVVEQDCVYLDLDGKDKKSYHFFGRDGKGNLVITARILPAGVAYKEVSIGRVCVDASIRGRKLGPTLMEQVLLFCREEFGLVAIRLSAQAHLENFYKKHGFISTGNTYLEDNIPHVEMLTTN